MLEVDRTMEKAASNHCPLRTSSSRSNPSWLYDVEDRMKMLLTISTCEENKAGETFAERAEWYYQKRPQLLALLNDLYNGYITLLDRCQKTKLKPHLCRTYSQLTADEEYENGDTTQIESDTESTISYQQPGATMATAPSQSCTNIDEIVAELVAKSVENNILANQVNEMDQLCNESGRKIELLKKLLELLESERIILMNENVKLGYQVSSLVEENKGLASEVMSMKRKAGELARYVLRLREDYRVCILSQKIEDLQEQIYGLEKRNKEYYNMLMKRDQLEVKEEIKSRNQSNSSSMRERLSHEVSLEGCSQSADQKLKLKKNKNSNWWAKVKTVDLFICGLRPSCS